MELGDGPYGTEETIRLPAEPASASVARDFVRSRIRRSGHPSLEDAALLCVSELVANVSVHTDSADCLVTVRDTVDEVTIEVCDDTRDLPSMEPESLCGEHGRGLRIVDAVSGEWGVRRVSAHCKSVWARLRDDPRPATT